MNFDQAPRIAASIANAARFAPPVKLRFSWAVAQGRVVVAVPGGCSVAPTSSPGGLPEAFHRCWG